MKPVFFDFGKNWKVFSRAILDESKIRDAEQSVSSLLGTETVQGKTFLDIGSGSGIFSIAAARLGASKVVGFDVSPNSVETARINAGIFSPDQSHLRFFQGSVFDVSPPQEGMFDIVYSWGVLHHTGGMWRAIERSLDFVSPQGVFAVALYNKHWSSPLWRVVKYVYNVSPAFLQKVMIGLFYPIIFVAKWCAIRKNPLTKDRGMDFYYDVIDWVGGYPYEYVSNEEMVRYMKGFSFDLVTYIPPEVPTGCHQWVFRKRA